MGQQCFVCEKKLGWRDIGYSLEHYEKAGLPIPSGLTNDDKICNHCFENQTNQQDNQKKELEKEIKQEASAEQKQLMDSIRARVPEYKPHWDKGGIIQFKNERIAILHRAWGAQVEFIIAYDDLTKEGYRLMAIDEGKETSAGGISGGVSSYYYFQKMEYVR